MPKSKLSESELLSIIESEISNAQGHYDGELSEQRAEAMDYYLGEPLGNEQEGRSQIVTTDVMDVIESIMPQLMRIFMSTDKAVMFEPEGPEDEEAAAQETDVINHVFYRLNNGFLTLYTLFKDALLQKNWFVRTYYDKSEKVTKETYEGLTDEQFSALINDSELEVIEYNENVLELMQDGQPQIIRTHDAKFKRTKAKGMAKVMAIPPEEMLVSKRTYSANLKDCPFICHRTWKTQTDLIEMGFSYEEISKLPSGDSRWLTEENQARHGIDESFPDQGDSPDQSMREIMIEDCYLYIDYDGDGVAELRHIMKAGKTVLINEEVDCHGFSTATPIILTHKLFGLSMADIVKDLQKINTTILRQVLDNLYLSNNVRVAAWASKVNLDDLLSSRPGGIVRTEEPPQNALMPLVHTPMHGAGIEMLRYFEELREWRTGVGRTSQGLNPDVLKDANMQVAGGIYSAIYMRIELIARMFAEGVKQLFLDIHEVMNKHQDIPLTIKLRNNWVTIDPRQWRERTDMTVSVGLGTGNRDSQIAQIGLIQADQEKLLSSGSLSAMVTPKHIYNAEKKKIEAMGLNPEEFIADPETVQPPPPPPPDPTIEILKAQLQLESQRSQLDAQQKEFEAQRKLAEMAANQEKALREERLKYTELELKYNQDIPGEGMGG